MSKKGYLMDKGIIVVQRGLTELDLFLKKFVEILKKHSDLIVSGYVSICSGRARGTEDIDIIIPLMNGDKFHEMFLNLLNNNFWCYQGDASEEAYPYMEGLNSIRFAKKNELFPNIELIPFDRTKKAKAFEFEHPQKIRVKNFEFKVPPIEFEILYKEMVLKSEKDIEDAKHLRIFFSDIIRTEKFKEYKPIIASEHESKNQAGLY